MFDKIVTFWGKLCRNLNNFVKKCHLHLTFHELLIYTHNEIEGEIMIDIYDSETIVKIYTLLEKKCDVIDKFIENHAFYFGSSSDDFGSLDVCNNIIELMNRKNQLINLKIIIDNAFNKLDDKDKKILLIKMNYNLSISEICGILDVGERTAFRRIENAFSHLADNLNGSKYSDKFKKIIEGEEWIRNIKNQIKNRRESYRSVSA